MPGMKSEALVMATNAESFDLSLTTYLLEVPAIQLTLLLTQDIGQTFPSLSTLHADSAMDLMFVSPSQIHMLKPNSQCDDMKRWGLWKVIES